MKTFTSTWPRLHQWERAERDKGGTNAAVHVPSMLAGSSNWPRSETRHRRQYFLRTKVTSGYCSTSEFKKTQLIVNDHHDKSHDFLQFVALLHAKFTDRFQSGSFLNFIFKVQNCSSTFTHCQLKPPLKNSSVHWSTVFRSQQAPKEQQHGLSVCFNVLVLLSDTPTSLSLKYQILIRKLIPAVGALTSQSGDLKRKHSWKSLVHGPVRLQWPQPDTRDSDWLTQVSTPWSTHTWPTVCLSVYSQRNRHRWTL